MEAETDIAELFARDPLKLSDQDLDAIILKLRGQARQFAAGNMKAGKTVKPKAAKTGLQLDIEL